MRKYASIVGIVVFLAILFQVVINLFVTEKDVSYELKTDDNEYIISEHLDIISKESFYSFEISDKDGLFYSFSIEEEFDEKSKVIQDIKFFKSNNVTCIFPIYLNDKTGNVSCLYKDEQVSYSYLMQINNTDISKIIKKLQDKNYNHNSWDEKSTKKVKLFEDGIGIDVYKDNLLDDYTFLIWRYKGLYILNSNGLLVRDYLEYEQYDNSNSILVGNYYVSVDSKSDAYGINELVYYDISKLKKKKLSLLDKTSNKYYFNGVYDNKLYLTDIGKGKQYSIDFADELVIEVGKKGTEFVVVKNGELKEIAPEEFLMNPLYFSNFVSNEEIIKKYGEDVEILKDGMFYYFKTPKGEIYRVYEENLEYAELLFKFDNLTEWKVNDGDIMVVAGDTVYFYTDSEGLIPIAINSELKYNHNNIVDFWKK